MTKALTLGDLPCPLVLGVCELGDGLGGREGLGPAPERSRVRELEHLTLFHTHTEEQSQRFTVIGSHSTIITLTRPLCRCLVDMPYDSTPLLNHQNDEVSIIFTCSFSKLSPTLTGEDGHTSTGASALSSCTTSDSVTSVKSAFGTPDENARSSPQMPHQRRPAPT
jgi:hypothetical protein